MLSLSAFNSELIEFDSSPILQISADPELHHKVSNCRNSLGKREELQVLERGID
jgi:hypothetical protein